MARAWLDLAAGPSGWIQATLGEAPALYRDIYVQLSKDAEGQWRPAGALFVPGLTPESIRTLPLRRILLAVNASDPLRDDLARRLEEPVEPFGTQEFYDSFSGWPQDELPPLKRPEKRNLPDTFYAEVAARYRDAVLRGLRPRPAIAEAAGVSGEVAGRWIREARRRGYLPATEPGKVRA